MAELERMSCFDESFHVSPRFCNLKLLGSGSTGLTVSALDTECDKHVAIKKILLNNMKDRISALREIRILRELQHDNIVKIIDVFLPSSDDADHKLREQVYIVQELCDIDMKQVIESECLKPDHVKLFTYQILRGLKYLHSANVVHRDLKPSNIFINLDDLTLKIGDFGLARIIDPLYCHKGHLTDNITTQCYRSPELMLHPQDYGKAIDMWAAGCILAEMLTGKILFAGEHDLELMGLILDSVPLTESDINDIICTLPSKLLKNYNGIAKRPLCELVPTNDKQVLHLLHRILAFCPQTRFSAKEALAHPYLKVFSDPQDEKSADKPFRIEDEVVNVSPLTLRKVILKKNICKSSKVPIDEQDTGSVLELEIQKSSCEQLFNYGSDMQERFIDFEKDIDELSQDELKEDDDGMSEKEDLSEKSESNKEEFVKTDDEMEWRSGDEIEGNGDNNVVTEKLNERINMHVEEEEEKTEKIDEIIDTKLKVEVPEEIKEMSYKTDEEQKAERLQLFENNRAKHLESEDNLISRDVIFNNSDSDSDKSDKSCSKNYRKNKLFQLEEKSKKIQEENNQILEDKHEKILDVLDTQYSELPTENKHQEENIMENSKWEDLDKNRGNEQYHGVNLQIEKASVVDLSKNKIDRSVRHKYKSNTSTTVGSPPREKTIDDCLSLPPRIEHMKLQPQRVPVPENLCVSRPIADAHPRDCNCTALSKINKKLNERLKQEYAIRHRTLFDSTSGLSELSQPLHIEIPVQPFLNTPSRLARNTSPKDKSVRPKRKRSSPNQRGKTN